MPPAVGAQNLNHWTAREVPQLSLKMRVLWTLCLLAGGGIQRAFAGLNKGAQERSQEGQRSLGDFICNAWATLVRGKMDQLEVALEASGIGELIKLWVGPIQILTA